MKKPREATAATAREKISKDSRNGAVVDLLDISLSTKNYAH